MVALSPFIILSLFASSPSTSNNRRRKNNKPNPSGTGNNRNRDENKRIGRSRYSRAGDKIRTKNNTKNRENNSLENNDLRQEVYPLPSLTKFSSSAAATKLPTYFTCRHTYEDTLIAEIERYANGHEALDEGNTNKKRILAMSPYPGLVRVEDDLNLLPSLYDPIYALQTIPDAVVISGDSIKNIAYAIYNALLGNDDDDSDDANKAELRQKLRSAPRGSLSIHALVPGMCKGQTKPVMLNRCEKVGEELTKMLRKGYTAARKNQNNNEIIKDENDDDNLIEKGEEKWLLQFMLQSNTIVVASLTRCNFVGPGNDAYWPNWNYPLGLADVSIEDKMPSSAYRKLMEGLECMRIHPSEFSKVVDLGACPGGWTAVMRRLGSFVTAVDRSKLDKSLMNDEMVRFVKGDAFTFNPEISSNDDSSSSHGEDDDTWMISDVIAYPERCTELLDSWCKQKWAKYMVVTMKFQGNEPALQELDNAIDIVKSYGYECRVKHFFNNKNEVTLMIAKLSAEDESYGTSDITLGKPMYKRVLPKD